jgi:hypothetical protein
MRVCPDYYSSKSEYLKSWVVEVSLDGEAWTAIDQKINKKV